MSTMMQWNYCHNVITCPNVNTFRAMFTHPLLSVIAEQPIFIYEDIVRHLESHRIESHQALYTSVRMAPQLGCHTILYNVLCNRSNKWIRSLSNSGRRPQSLNENLVSLSLFSLGSYRRFAQVSVLCKVLPNVKYFMYGTYWNQTCQAGS